MIVERLWDAIKSARLGCSLGCALMVAGVLLWDVSDRFCWIALGIGLVLGFLGFVIGFSTNGKTPEQLRARALRKIRRECARSRYGLEIVDSAVIRVGREVTMGERAGEAFDATFGRGKARIDFLQTVRFKAPQGYFHLVIPWSGPNMLPHEFFSWMYGHLPFALTLKRGALGSWSNGRWVGPHGEVDHPLARAAEEHPIDLNSGTKWNWEKDDYRIELQWGIMAVPVDKYWYIHVMQTGLQEDLARKSFGLDWYVPRWVAFFLFIKELQLDGEQEKKFLFQPRSLFVFHQELGMDAEDLMPLEDRVRRPAKIGDLL